MEGSQYGLREYVLGIDRSERKRIALLAELHFRAYKSLLTYLVTASANNKSLNLQRWLGLG